MPNIQNTASFQAPSDYNVEAQRIARQKALAQALQEQGMQQDGGTQVVGGWAIPNSPLVGLGKMAQVLSGKYQENKAIEDEKKLAERSNADRQQTLARAMALGQGTPDLASDPSKINMAYVNNGTMSDAIPELRPQPTVTPTTPQQRNLAIAKELSLSGHPDLRAQGDKLMLEALTKENNPANSLFAKVDASKFTPDSIAAFLKSNNYADLKAREKVVADRLGDKLQYRGEYSTNPMGTAAIGVSPDTTARLNWDQYQFNNLSANQVQSLANDRANIANRGLENIYNTGQGVTSPIFSGIPQNAHMQPAPTDTPAPAAPPAPPVAPRPAINQPRPAINQPRPAFAPGATTPGGQPLPQRLQNEITVAGEKQKLEMGNKREFNMGGLNDALDEAESILTGQKTGKTPTSSGIGSMVDSMAAWGGLTTSGAAEADRLKSIGGALVAKMPRMEGPQSDKDVMLYREMAGRVGDDTIPIRRRLDALQEVRKLYAKYDKQSTGGASGGWDGADRRQTPRSTSNRVVVDY